MRVILSSDRIGEPRRVSGRVMLYVIQDPAADAARLANTTPFEWLV
jgi:hypothetical protein